MKRGVVELQQTHVDVSAPPSPHQNIENGLGVLQEQQAGSRPGSNLCWEALLSRSVFIWRHRVSFFHDRAAAETVPSVISLTVWTCCHVMMFWTV